MLERRIESVFGWPLRLSTSPNQRTLYNFPMQAAARKCCGWRRGGCARPASCRSCSCTTASCSRRRTTEQIEHAKEIMLQAGRDVCDGFEIGVDVDQMLEGGARYRDKRPMANEMWATIMRALQAVGVALPKQDAA